MKKPSVLTIGGSDPSCGAGIQADIQAFELLNVHPTSVITCITLQNTISLKEIIPLPVNQIEKQIDMIMEDISPSYVKTGLLYSKEIIELVVKKQEEYKWKLIVDPIITSTTGKTCVTKDYISSLKSKLLPKTYLITPNIPEANQIIQDSIKNINSMKSSAKNLQQLGCNYVFLKGGHLEQSTDAIDMFYDGKSFHILSLPMIKKPAIHGTGCVLSSLITGYLCKNDKPKVAVQKAKHALWQMMQYSYQPGKGMNVSNLFYPIFQTRPPFFESFAYQNTWQEFSSILPNLINELSEVFIAEVGCNMGYAISNAKTYQDICAFKNRLIKPLNKNQLPTLVFGGSKHVASIILSVMNQFPDNQCAMNIRYNEKILNACNKAIKNIASFDRSKEPKNTKSTMEWGTSYVLKSSDTCPDIIYDKGGIGKEPMIRLIGKNPQEIVSKLHAIKRNYE